MPTKTVGCLLLNCTDIIQRDNEKLRAIKKQLMAKCEHLVVAYKGALLLQWENRKRSIALKTELLDMFASSAKADTKVRALLGKTWDSETWDGDI